MQYSCEKPVSKDVGTGGVKIRRKSQDVWRLSLENFQKSGRLNQMWSNGTGGFPDLRHHSTKRMNSSLSYQKKRIKV